jgi:hypothetical protein
MAGKITVTYNQPDVEDLVKNDVYKNLGIKPDNMDVVIEQDFVNGTIIATAHVRPVQTEEVR